MNITSRPFLAAGVVAALAFGTLTLVSVKGGEEGEGKPPAPAPAPAAAEDPGALVRALGAEEFALREKAYRLLRDLGESAREALETGAASGDAQVSWAAGRLLRLLDDAPGEAGNSPDRRLRFREEERTEEKREGDRGSESRDWWFAGSPEAPRQDLGRLFEEMRRRMREMEERFEEMGVRPFDRALLPHGGMGIQRRVIVERNGERTEVDVETDGRIRVVIGGKEGPSTYEAASMEDLAKKHPEVHARVRDLVGEGGGIALRFEEGPAPEGRGTRGPVLPFNTFPHLEIPRALGSGGARLGATVREIPELLRSHLPLLPGEGLAVEEVLPGTAAERLGVRRHDLLLAVNGIPVSSAVEVRSAMGAVKEGGELRLRVLREGRERVLEGTR